MKTYEQSYSQQDIRQEYRQALSHAAGHEMWHDHESGRTLRIVGCSIDEEDEIRFNYVDLMEPDVVRSMRVRTFFGSSIQDDGSEVPYRTRTNRIFR